MATNDSLEVLNTNKKKKRKVTFASDVKIEDTGGRSRCADGNCFLKWSIGRCKKCNDPMCQECFERGNLQEMICAYCRY